MSIWKTFTVLRVIMMLILIPVVASLDFPEQAATTSTVTVNTYSSNITNINDLNDTTLGSPSNNQIIKFDSTTYKWILGTDNTGSGSNTFDGNYSSVVNFTVLYSFDYYNSSDFTIGNYRLITDSYNQSQIDDNIASNSSGSGSDTFAGNYSVYVNLTRLFDYGYYNSSTFSESDPNFLANLSSLVNWTSLLNQGYYNASDFDIDNYYTKTQTDANILGNSSADGATNSTYSTHSDVNANFTVVRHDTFLGNYSITLNISNFWTYLLAQSYYNASDFNIADYLLTSNFHVTNNTYSTHSNVNANFTAIAQDTFSGNYSVISNISITYNQTNLDAIILGNVSPGASPTFVGTNYSTNLNTSNGYNQSQIEDNRDGNDTAGNPTFVGTNYSTNLNTSNGYTGDQIDTNIEGNVTTDTVGNNATFVGTNYSTNLNTSNGYNQTNLDAIILGNVSGGSDTFFGNYSSYLNITNFWTNLLAQNYYNSSDFDIADYLLIANFHVTNNTYSTHSNVNANFTAIRHDTFLGNYSSYINWTSLLAQDYYNSSNPPPSGGSDTFFGNYSSYLNNTVFQTLLYANLSAYSKHTNANANYTRIDSNLTNLYGDLSGNKTQWDSGTNSSYFSSVYNNTGQLNSTGKAYFNSNITVKAITIIGGGTLYNNGSHDIWE